MELKLVLPGQGERPLSYVSPTYTSESFEVHCLAFISHKYLSVKGKGFGLQKVPQLTKNSMLLLVASKSLVWSSALIFTCADILIYTTFIHFFFHSVHIYPLLPLVSGSLPQALLMLQRQRQKPTYFCPFNHQIKIILSRRQS